MSTRNYDVAVIGGGPGGTTAALYCARAGYSVAVIEKLTAGGQMASTETVDNYPGFDEGIDGFELGERMMRGAERFGAETIYEDVRAVELDASIKKIATDGGELTARAVVIATGAHPRTLGLPEEKALVGRGVAYCATCDGMRYRGKSVVVIGGGNSAAADALTLSKLCEKVTLVHRRDSLRASRVYSKALADAGVEFVWNSRVERILSDHAVTGVRLADVQTGAQSEFACEGVFVAIGRVPETALFRDKLELDDRGYLVADESTRTRLNGVYAVGDVRTKALRQIVTAAADGAVAAHFIEQELG